MANGNEIDRSLQPCPDGCQKRHPKANVLIWLGTTPPLVTRRTDGCPEIIEVWMGAWQGVAALECDPNFDYGALIQKAYNRVAEYIRDYQCPTACPYKEFFTLPEVERHISVDCSRVGTGVLYAANVRGYFVCTDFQF